MRRALAAAILGPSLLVASLAWSAFGMLNTMLDPLRSERIADTLLEDELVQQQLRQSIAGAVSEQLPEAVPVTDAQLESGAGVALENPVVEVLIRDAFVQAHQALLGEAEPPTTLDVGAAAGDVRDGALSGVPGGTELIPDGPGLVIDLPTSQIPNLGGFRRWLQRAAPLMALAAAAGVALALLTAKNRASVLRRAGVWAIGSSVIWLVLNVGLPWVAEQYFSGQAAIATAMIDALFGAMLTPSIVLACCGLGLVVVSMLWPSGRDAGDRRSDGGGVLMRRQMANEGPKPSPLYAAPERDIQPHYIAPSNPPPSDPPSTSAPSLDRSPAPHQPPASAVSKTVADPAAGSIHRPVGNPARAQPQKQQAPHQSQQSQAPQAQSPSGDRGAPVEPGEWVSGVGYVSPEKPATTEPTGFERSQSPVGKKPDPKWVAGLGYVDENGEPIEPD